MHMGSATATQLSSLSHRADGRRRAAHLALGLVATIGLPALAALAAPQTARPVPPPVGGASAALQFAPPYAYESTWTPPPAAARPLDIALGAESVLLADGRINQVQVYEDSGQLADRWDAPASTAVTGTDAVIVPMRVAVDPALDVAYVLWQRWAFPPRVTPVPETVWLERRDLAGADERTLHALPFWQLGDIAWHAESGQLFVAADRSIHRVDPATGTVTALPVQYPAASLASLAASGDRLALLMRGVTGSRVALYALDGAHVGDVAMTVSPVAVARREPEGFTLLLAPPDPAAPDAALLVDVPADGTLAAERTVAALDVPGPTNLDWPWALDASADRVALTSTMPGLVGDSLTPAPMHAIAWGHVDAVLRSLSFSTAFATPFQPRPGYTPASRGAPAVSASGAGVAVLDCSASTSIVNNSDCGHSGSRALQLDAGLGLRSGRLVPQEAVDVAIDATGRLFVVNADAFRYAGSQGKVMIAASSLTRLGPVHTGLPEWSVPCDCPAGGRLAAGTGVLYATRPQRREVSAYDPGTGTGLATVTLGQTRGMWPSDVTIGPGGKLFTADLGGARVQRFAGPGQPESVWPGGGVLGPVHVAAGPWQADRPVVVAIMVDGALEVHDADDGELLARWRPVLPNGTAIDAADLAIAPNGTLYLSDRNGSAVHTFRPEEGPVPPPAEPGPTPTPSAYQCTVRGDKTAGPRQVVLGNTAGVTLTLHADCPTRSEATGADIVLVADTFHRAGMLPYFAVATTRALLGQLDFALHRAGAIFELPGRDGGGATLRFPLSTDPAPILAHLDAPGREYGDGARLIRDAIDMLATDARPEALQVIVAMIDGGGRVDAVQQALVAARNAGILVFVIVESNVPELADAVGSPERYLVNPSPSQLYTIYAHILRVAGISMAGNLTIDDAMAPDIDLVPGSPRPAAVERDARLSWGRSLLPATGLTLTYRVRPTRIGILPVNSLAVARYTDFDGAERELVYPVPEIEVVLPTSTPTPSATPTPEPVAIYLPIALKAQCLATTGHVDVVLLVDASTSMAGENIAAAKRAAKAFVGELDLARDQAAVIGFNSSPMVARGLSRNPAVLAAAIDGLALGPGTRMDLALREAIDLLLVSPARHPGNRPVVILLTDGIHEGSGEDVVREAERGRRQGMLLYAIRLGTAASEALLRRVADPGAYYEAPDAAMLDAIYLAIAGEVPCL